MHYFLLFVRFFFQNFKNDIFNLHDFFFNLHEW